MDVAAELGASYRRVRDEGLIYVLFALRARRKAVRESEKGKEKKQRSLVTLHLTPLLLGLCCINIDLDVPDLGPLLWA